MSPAREVHSLNRDTTNPDVSNTRTPLRPARTNAACSSRYANPASTATS